MHASIHVHIVSTTAAVRMRLQALCALTHVLGGGHQHGGGDGAGGAAAQQDAARLLAALQAQPELVPELVDLVRAWFAVFGFVGCFVGFEGGWLGAWALTRPSSSHE